jgi:hypothetical protein
MEWVGTLLAQCSVWGPLASSAFGRPSPSSRAEVCVRELRHQASKGEYEIVCRIFEKHLIIATSEAIAHDEHAVPTRRWHFRNEVIEPLKEKAAVDMVSVARIRGNSRPQSVNRRRPLVEHLRLVRYAITNESDEFS